MNGSIAFPKQSQTSGTLAFKEVSSVELRTAIPEWLGLLGKHYPQGVTLFRQVQCRRTSWLLAIYNVWPLKQYVAIPFTFLRVFNRHLLSVSRGSKVAFISLALNST